MSLISNSRNNFKFEVCGRFIAKSIQKVAKQWAFQVCFALSSSMFLIPLIYKSLTINAFNGIFVLTHCFYVAWIRVHSHEKSGSDRKCINIHFNNSGYKFPDYLMNFHKKVALQ